MAAWATAARHGLAFLLVSTRTTLLPRRYAFFDPCGAGTPGSRWRGHRPRNRGRTTGGSVRWCLLRGEPDGDRRNTSRCETHVGQSHLFSDPLAQVHGDGLLVAPVDVLRDVPGEAKCG